MTTTQHSPAPQESRWRRLLGGGGVLTACIMAMNLGTFGFQFLAARLLGLEHYGAVARTMALLLVLGVLQLGLQATAARRVSVSPDRVREIERTMIHAGTRTAVALGVGLLVLAPLLAHLLHLDGVVPALLIALTGVPLTVMGAQAGVLQGERRWRELAGLYLANGVPRLVLGAAAMLVSPTQVSALAAVALAQWAPVIVGWLALRRTMPRGRARTPMWPVLVETGHGSVMLLAFFVLANVDILLAGGVLARADASLYAAGLILTKVVLFLPQAVVVVAFPAMSTPGQRRGVLLGSTAAVLAVGAVCTAGAWLLSGLALVFVGGPAYAGVEDRLWLFALLGMLLAVLQLLVYSVLADRFRAAAWVIWAAVGALTALVLTGTVDGVAELLSATLLIDAVLVALLLALSLWRLRAEPET